jgi:hypothetical protein
MMQEVTGGARLRVRDADGALLAVAARELVPDLRHADRARAHLHARTSLDIAMPNQQ